MSDVRGREKTPGEFRKLQVAIGSDYRFIPPPPQAIAGLLDSLEKYINQETDKKDRLIQAFLAHYQFETIHPFMDGNGRVGRILLALMMYKLCDHEMPWLYLSPFFERYKDEYVNNLFRVSTNGDWSTWIEFCLRGTIVSAKDAINRCRMLGQLKERYGKRLQSQVTTRTHQIVISLFQDAIVRVVDIQRNFEVAYQTARVDIDILRRAGILKQLKGHYPASFFAWEIFEIAYRDEPRYAGDEEIRAVISDVSSETNAQEEQTSQSGDASQE